MKKITLVILLLLTCLSIFAKTRKHKKKSTSGNDIVSVLMYRTACFGRCPTYKIEITSDGMVTYTAIRFCEDTGVFKKNIGSAKALEVLNEFNTYHVDTCRDMYQNRIQDVPGIMFTIKYKNNVKAITNANFGPPFLRQLALEMDAVGKKTDNSWQKVDSTANN